MSLINDALKRASQTAKDRPAQADLPAAMEPVREPARPKSNFALVGILAAVAILAASGWFFRQWYRQRHAHSAQPVVTSSTVVQKLVPIVSKPAPANPASAPHPVETAAGTAASIVNESAISNGSPSVVPPAHPLAAPAPASPQPVPVLATVPPPSRTTAPQVIAPPSAAQPAAAFPNLQVKGIFYNRKHPHALINGDTVGEGDSVMGVRILEIRPDRVVLEFNGKVKQLLVGE